MGIGEDIHLYGDNYQWLGSMFYFGKSLLFSSPSRISSGTDRLDIQAT